MSWATFLSVMVGIFVVLLAIGTPVVIAFLAVDILGLVWIRGFSSLSLITSTAFDSVGSITLGAIPLFYLLGEVLFQSRTVDIILDAVDKWIGRIRARLNIVAVVVGTVLGALSGSFMADAAVLGSTLLPEMRRRGYEKKLACGSIMSAGSLAAIIPPSILAVLVGSLANVSISKLLLGGVGPGLMLAAFFILYILLRVKLDPELAPAYESSSVPLMDKIRAILLVLPFALIILLVMGLILLGIATPTESAATGAIGAMVVAALYRRMSFNVLRKSLLATLRVTGMIFFIIVGSMAFSQLLALSGATRELLEAIVTVKASPLTMYIIMQAIPFILGCFIDQNSITMLAVPIYAPVVSALNFDPILFWLIFLLNLIVGGITPPFGLALFVIKGVAPDFTMLDLYKAALPFVLIIVTGMILIGVFPEIALWLPNQLSG